MPSSPHGVQFESHRPDIMGRKGMVAAGHPLASQAGMSILQQGGNAVDAAIAVAAAVNVVEPQMSGIGGDGFIMVYSRDRGKIEVANGTGPAPLAATRERYAETGIPEKGLLSVSVPGLLDAWLAAHERYGSLPISEVFAPAVELARDGFPVSAKLAKDIASDTFLCNHPVSNKIFAPGGRGLGAGEILYQRDLANTFEMIASGGAEVFYRGEIAEAIARYNCLHDGLLSLEDLGLFHGEWQDPISTTYHGHTVFEAPPNSSGHVLLQELNIIEQLDIRDLGCNTPEAVHVMVEAKKLSFADREAYVADPDYLDIPMDGLLSKMYAWERACLIDRRRVNRDVVAGNPYQYQDGPASQRQSPRRGSVRDKGGDTTCFVVVDRWGNAVSQLQSQQTLFGSGVVVDGTGILLNDRMTYWHLDPDHINCLMPGRRVRHTMNPVMVFEGEEDAMVTGELVLACGTPGADTQVQTNMQVITHVLDFGLNVSEAVEAPRWRHLQNNTESTEPREFEDRLQLEGRFPEEARKALEEKGHGLEILEDWGASGSEVMIRRDPSTGALFGAADPRRDGYAIGW